MWRPDGAGRDPFGDGPGAGCPWSAPGRHKARAKHVVRPDGVLSDAGSIPAASTNFLLVGSVEEPLGFLEAEEVELRLRPFGPRYRGHGEQGTLDPNWTPRFVFLRCAMEFEDRSIAAGGAPPRRAGRGRLQDARCPSAYEKATACNRMAVLVYASAECS